MTPEEPVYADNANGERTTQPNGWTQHPPIWARIIPTSAKETTQGNRQLQTITHTLNIRHHPDIRGDWRLDFKGRKLAIVGIVNRDEADVEQDITCAEVTR